MYYTNLSDYYEERIDYDLLDYVFLGCSQMINDPDTDDEYKMQLIEMRRHIHSRIHH